MPSTVFDHPIFPGSKIIKKDITVTNTSGAYSETITDDRISAGMQVNKMYVEDPSVFRSDISVQTLGGSFVFSCSDVVGTTDVTLEFLKIADDPNGITSTEFNVLNNKIGEVPSGTTLQGEIESINENLPSLDIITDGSFTVANSNGIISNISEKVVGGYQFRVQKYGNIVSIQMYVEMSSGTTDATIIAALKEGLRPHYFTIANTTDSNFIAQSYGISISSNGNINFRTQNTLTQNVSIRSTVVFIAD